MVDSLGNGWFQLKSYTVNMKDLTCDCMSGTMRMGGAKQPECRHVREVREYLAGKLKEMKNYALDK